MRIHSIKGLINNRDISFQLILRETRSRYKGSKLGLAWTAINPAIMICIYTLIFSQVFKARWHSGDNEINTWDDKYMHIADNMCNNKWIHTPDIVTAAIDMDANDIRLRRTNLDNLNDRCIH